MIQPFFRSANRRLQHTTTTKKHNHSTIAPSVEGATQLAPTSLQLRRVFITSAVPMFGFGFMDQTVMIQAGHLIDCTIGVTFGLSTLTAAAFGQICSDASGVVFGTTLEGLAQRAGLPSANLSSVQRSMAIVKRFKFAGTFLGVMLGCTLGLVNLLMIDTSRSSTLKLQAFNEEQEFEFTIEASNAVRKDATALTVRGPDVDGMLASMTAALAVRGCSLVELHAKRNAENMDNETKTIQDVFYVVQRNSQLPFDDDDLQDLAQDLMDSTRTPMNVNSFKAAMHDLEKDNNQLRSRVSKLEQVVIEKQITIVPTPQDEVYEEQV